jgi:hypothetical protein
MAKKKVHVTFPYPDAPTSVCTTDQLNRPHQTTSTFDATSTHYCATWTLDVKIDLGGEANWNSHVKSAAHVRLEGSASASRFFSKFPPKARSAHLDAASSSTRNIPTAISPTLGDFDTPEPPTSPQPKLLTSILCFHLLGSCGTF